MNDREPTTDGPAASAGEGDEAASGATGPDDRPEAGGNDPALTFPDLPRLELDELLGQLVDRAREVLATQGRLRSLLHAHQALVADLELPVLLRRIPEVARDLVAARYAALGVIGEGGGFSEFLHVGLPAESVARGNQVPPAEGLLRRLLDDPSPLRLREVTGDQHLPAFPFGPEPLRGFLGVPIWVRGELFANLYLADSEHGEFSGEDEELTKSLAATAGGAIGNARLYALGQLRQRWLHASAAITHRLLSDDATDTAVALRVVAESSRDIADADRVAVLLPADEGELRVELAVGFAADSVNGRTVAIDGSLAGQVHATGRPVRAIRPDDGGVTGLALPEDRHLGPMLAVPLTGLGQARGVLTVARVRGRPAFTPEDVEMAAGFANQASVALALAQARAEHERLAMLDDRGRIAAELNDDVISLLFAAGLSMQSVAAALGHGRQESRLLAAVADLDRAIGRIRTSVFALNEQPPGRQDASAGAGAGLLQVIGEFIDALGFEPATRFTGPLDAVPPDVFADLAAALRESLTNIARHAGARSAEVDVAVAADTVTLQITDDGIGMAAVPKDGGLADLRRRASWHGGELTIGPGAAGGTQLCWTAFLHQRPTPEHA